MRPRIGDRVQITGLMDDPDPLPVGLRGTVNWLGAWTGLYNQQIGVQWDDGRTLMLLPSDPFKVIGRSRAASTKQLQKGSR